MTIERHAEALQKYMKERHIINRNAHKKKQRELLADLNYKFNLLKIEMELKQTDQMVSAIPRLEAMLMPVEKNIEYSFNTNSKIAFCAD